MDPNDAVNPQNSGLIDTPLARAERFCTSFGMKVPILLAPMAGACPPALSIAVANAGGMGACGALLMPPAAIDEWVDGMRSGSDGPFQLNLWIPGRPPTRDRQAEAALRGFLAQWGPEVPAEAGDATPPDFDAQCEAMLTAGPPVISSVMGLYPPDFVARMKQAGIAWVAGATTVAEAEAAEAAGADAILAQGMEAGGHRGSFKPEHAELKLVGLFSLIPAVADAVDIPVIAAGGIADGRSIAAALLLGASAVAIGTGFLRCPEAGLPPAWAEAIGRTRPDDTILTRAFSGRLGRSIATDYALAAARADAPEPAPYPVQRGLTGAMREAAKQDGHPGRMQAWAGQSAWMARDVPAGELVGTWWRDARNLLAGP